MSLKRKAYEKYDTNAKGNKSENEEPIENTKADLNKYTIDLKIIQFFVI